MKLLYLIYCFLQLILWQSERPFTLGYPQILKEFLIATSFTSVQRNLPLDANKLINLLPITSQKIGYDFEVDVNGIMVCLSQDVLWNASMMLLSPQQRIVPYRSDIWVKLWEQLAKLSKGVQRFMPSQVVDKLMVSLVCYQVSIMLETYSLSLKVQIMAKKPETAQSPQFIEFLITYP